MTQQLLASPTIHVGRTLQVHNIEAARYPAIQETLAKTRGSAADVMFSSAFSLPS